ncbi:MAG: TIGR04283 family arsenosugar biosynthesis glycosyltransferase [Thermoanaerobaculia bacterium]
MPSLSIVIPTLDEEAGLERALRSARRQADEVVVSDGGSTDGTLAIARRFGIEPIVGPPGRGGQIRRGTELASGDVVLVLHADSVLPDTAGESVRAAVAAGAVGGGFLVRFESASKLVRCGERLVNWRTRVARVPLGDQAQFATRAALDRLGGFPDWPILEDVDFIRRLRRLGPIAVVDAPVGTSARRFTAWGGVRAVAANWLILALYFAGVSPHRLARLYPNIR